jgi:hypothetical protein
MRARHGFRARTGSADLRATPRAGTTRPGVQPVAEVYPALWSRNFAREGRTGDQHDAPFSTGAPLHPWQRTMITRYVKQWTRRRLELRCSQDRVVLATISVCRCSSSAMRCCATSNSAAARLADRAVSCFLVAEPHSRPVPVFIGEEDGGFLENAPDRGQVLHTLIVAAIEFLGAAA